MHFAREVKILLCPIVAILFYTNKSFVPKPSELSKSAATFSYVRSNIGDRSLALACC